VEALSEKGPETVAAAFVGSVEYPNFARMLGASAWARLPAAVRARFPAVHGAEERVCYRGTMQCVRASALGRVLAWIAKLFETPVAPYTGTEVPTEVMVYPKPEVNGVVWERVYHFPGRAPVTVRSTKCLDGAGRLIESLGRGLRMKLTLGEENGSLRFTSTGYYLELLGVTVHLPDWFPPGVTHVIHTDQGDGRFRFTMYTEHPWFGAMFFQEGIFTSREAGR